MGAPGDTGAILAERLASVQWPLGYDTFHTSGTAPIQISYSFETSRPADLTGWDDVSGWGSYTAAERATVRAALDHYETFINVTFVEQSAENAVDITFLRASEGVSGGRGRFSFYTGPLEYDAFVLFNTNRDISRPGDFDLVLHEIGHALSLKHPGNYDVNPLNAPPGPYLPSDQDNDRFTVMSYFGSDDLAAEARALMLYDVAALQERWGVNGSTNAGNQTHVLGTSDAMRVIWDTGGTDTISAAAVSGGAVVDLREGHFSAAGGFDRLVVAYGSAIEDARGGSGADVLRGNDLANRLWGQGGNDTLEGGAGADYLDGGAGNDRLSGGLGNDFYIVGSALDVIEGELAYSQGGGIDTVRTYVQNYVQPDNIELVRLANPDSTLDLNATGNSAPGTLVGNAGNNRLSGGYGNDQVNGNDGDDRLSGDHGRDTLVGGAGADTFVYATLSDSRAGTATRDVINGFERGADRIDLSAVDAISGGGDNAFRFIGNAGFSGTAGELRTQGLGGANAILVEADLDGDGAADMQIFVNLTTFMEAGDFIL